MRKLLYSLVVLALVSTIAGCGGTSSGKTSTQSTPGASTITFSIPLHQPGSQFAAYPASRSGVNPTFVRPKPEYIDASANGKIYGYIDGGTANQETMTIDLGLIDWSTNSPVISDPTKLNGSAGPSSNGSTISWTSTLATTSVNGTNNSPSVVANLNVVATITTVVGVPHTFGVVQTNGPCLKWGGAPCLTGNDGYVLAENQVSFTPSAGTNAPITLTLAGVLEAGFFCSANDTACSYFGTPDAAGWYHYLAFPTDENGTPVIPQAKLSDWAMDSGWNTSYDNGKWEIAVTSGPGVVTVLADDYTANAYFDINPAYSTNPTLSLTSFNAPNPVERLHSGLWWDARGFKFQCQTTGSATIAMRMVQGSKSQGNVAGFTYNSGDYPASGALLGATGNDLDLGNGAGITVDCSGTQVFNIR